MIDDLAALRLQMEWGADEAIGTAPLDRFAPAPNAPRPTAQRRVASETPPPLAPTPQAQTLDALMDELAKFDGCGLRTTAMQLVRPDGNPAAKLVILGDAPGSDDDRSGRAFSGATGQLVDRVLASVGFDRQSVLLTTLVPWRPPGNRRLSDSEIQACLPFVQRLLGIVRPTHLLLLGAQALRALAGEDASLRRLRGRWTDVQVTNERLTIAALALPAPDQWLTSASARQLLWSDMMLLRSTVTTD